MAKAFLFDLNGTMIDDMGYHVKAWHRIIHELGGNLTLEETKLQCYGKNDELLERVFPGQFALEKRYAIGLQKEEQYQREFRPYLQLIDGLESFLTEAHAKGIKMAIGSAAIMFNIDFVLDGLSIRHYFDAIVSADDVVNSKPDPETYLKCATLLGVEPADCIVFEDAPKGIESAQRAGMPSVVLTTLHEAHEFSQYHSIAAIGKDFNEPSIRALL